MLRASLSFTELAGLKYSAFTYRSIPSGARLFILMAGVLPTVSKMLLNFMSIECN